MGLFRLVPVVFIVVAIVLAINHYWIPFAILIVFAVFGFWLIAMYGGSERMGR
jgi:hypothetical protein